MPSGHAGHSGKGSNIKSNNNVANSGASAEIPTETAYPYDDRGEVNPDAVERAAPQEEAEEEEAQS